MLNIRIRVDLYGDGFVALVPENALHTVSGLILTTVDNRYITTASEGA